MEDNINAGLVFGSGKKAEKPLIDEGKYEAQIVKVEKKTSDRSGNKYLRITFQIRTDANQSFAGRLVSYTIFGRDDDITGYDFNAINSLIVTQEDKPTYETHFDTIDDVLLYLNGLKMTIYVTSEVSKINGKTYNIVDGAKFGKSTYDEEHPVEDNLKPVGNEGAKGVNLESIDIQDDDCPF